MLQVEEKVPYLKGRLVKREIRDDAEYVSSPLLGGIIFQSKRLNVAQVKK